MYYKGEVYTNEAQKNKYEYYWTLQVNQWHKSGVSVAYSGITKVDSLKSCSLFFVLSVTHTK